MSKAQSGGFCIVWERRLSVRLIHLKIVRRSVVNLQRGIQILEKCSNLACVGLIQ